MGERIQAARWFIRSLRRCEQPRYSFEHFVANVLLGLVCFVLPLLGEHKLCAMLVAVLVISCAVQGLRLWWFMRRRDREAEAWLMQAMEGDADA